MYQPSGLTETKSTLQQVKNPFSAKLIPYPLKNQETNPLDSTVPKQPLILIHGLNGETAKLCLWKSFLKTAEKKPGFKERYQVYLYRYDSRKSLESLGSEFQKNLKPIIENPNQPPLEILAYSQGGLISRIALKNPEINAHTEKVITVATPFHGSPLANPSWLRRQLQSIQSFSVIKFTQRLAYWVTGRLYPEFEKDFHWDNFDQALKFEDESKFSIPEESKAYLGNYQNKFITYGSYFGAEIDPHLELPKALGVNTPIPPSVRHPKNPFSIHFFFAQTQKSISKMPLVYHVIRTKVLPIPLVETTLPSTHNNENEVQTNAPSSQVYDSPSIEIPPLMAYNDGISPISSTLWLGRELKNKNDVMNTDSNATQNNIPLKMESQLWNALLRLKQNHQARVFSGLDHRDWTDNSTRTKSLKIKDLLQPDLPEQTAFDWMLQDLMGPLNTPTSQP